MKNILLIIQIIISTSLVIFILIQSKGTGLGRVWGGNVSFARRGLEKILFKLTFALTALFIIVSILSIILP